MAGVREVANVHAHTGPRLALAAEGERDFDRAIFERSVALVPVQLVGLSIVCHEQIGVSALVIVEHGDAEGFRTAVEDAAGGGDVLEGTITAIVKQPAGLAAI